MTYVLSDIHGQMRRFKSVIKQINLQPEDTLYVLSHTKSPWRYGRRSHYERRKYP